MELEQRETDTILAALRYYQRDMARQSFIPLEILEIAHNDHGDPLTATEIDDLCEELNS